MAGPNGLVSLLAVGDEGKSSKAYVVELSAGGITGREEIPVANCDAVLERGLWADLQ